MQEESSAEEAPVARMSHNYWRRAGLAFLACLQNSLIGGLIYGWASIDRSMLSSSNEAKEGGGGAGLSPADTTRIFSCASSVAMVATLVLGGAVLDRFGPRTCSVVSHTSIASGCLLFAMARNFEMFALATCLMAFGGPGIQLSIVHVANLFPENQYLVLSGVNGTISISFAVFAVFDWLWNNLEGISFRTLFGSYVIVVVVSLISSIVFWPDEPFEAPDKKVDEETWEPTPEEAYVEAATAHQHLLEQPLDSYLRTSTTAQDHGAASFHRSPSYLLSRKAIDRGVESLISLKDQPFHRQVISATYLRALVFLLVTCFLANFYVASFSTELADFNDFDPDEQHELAVILTLIMSLGVLASFIVGWLMDRLGLEVCAALTLVLGQMQLIILLVLGNKRPWLIQSFVVYGFFRQFLFPVFIASLTARLGFKYFGLLMGLAFALSGLTQAYMASLVRIVQGDCHLVSSFDAVDAKSDCSHGLWRQLHYVQVIVLGVLLLSTFFEHRAKRRRERQVREVLGSPPSFNYGSLQLNDESTRESYFQLDRS